VDKVKAFLKDNWKHVAMLLVMLGGFSFVKFQKGEKFEVYVVLPDELPDVFGQQPAKAAGDTFSPRGLTALRLAGARLRNDDSDGGRKLFAVLQRLHNDPYSLNDVEAATKATAIDPLTLTLIAKIALKIAVAYLEIRAPRTESEWDDRLLALLKLFADRPETINAAHAAILNRGP
jgi:uncharacterized membrane protein (DUF2068 family)